MNRVFFARHGAYQWSGGGLSPEGRDQAQTGGRILRYQEGIRENAIILASVALRTVETAEIIAQEINASVVQSKVATVVGDNPVTFKNLGDFLGKVKEVDGYEIPEQAPDIVVVTHLPLIRLIKGAQDGTSKDQTEVGYGEIVQHTLAADWVNPKYEAELADLMLRPGNILRYLNV